MNDFLRPTFINAYKIFISYVWCWSRSVDRWMERSWYSLINLLLVILFAFCGLAKTISLGARMLTVVYYLFCHVQFGITSQLTRSLEKGALTQSSCLLYWIYEQTFGQFVVKVWFEQWFYWASRLHIIWSYGNITSAINHSS